MKLPEETTLETRLAGWFASHAGLITRSQAVALGLSPTQIDRRVRIGAWARVYPSVYHLAGAPLGPHARLRAAVLAGGHDAVASHESAAWLWGLRDEPGLVPTITVPHTRSVRLSGLRAFRSRHPIRPVVRRGVPCVDLVRTIVDCASGASATEVDDLVDRALARRAIRIEQLIKAINVPADPHRRGRPLLAEALRRRGVTGSPNPSVLESRMGRLLVRHGLTPPEAEVVWGPHGRYRLDFAYPTLRLAIEVDGWAAHFLPEQQRRDHRRGNTLSRAGWIVLHYDWWEVTYDADRVAREIAETYRGLAAAA